ncbi:MAG: wax ester/triacylglycerol synthase family O-acyltransferase [Mycobacteriales bacterium]
MTVTDRHLRPTDAFSYALEKDPLLRSTVVVVGLLDRWPDLDALRAGIDRATRAAPAFRDRIVTPPLRLAPPRWVQVEELDLDWHVRHVAAAPPCGLAEVLDLARVAATSPFDPARPLWTLTVVDGLVGGRAAFVLAFHHALTDGIGGVALAHELFDVQREPGPREPATAPPAEHLEGWRLTWDSLLYDAGKVARSVRTAPAAALRTSAQIACHPREAVRTAASIARTVEPFFRTRSPVMRDRRLDRALDVLEVPLADLRAAAAACGCHLNDAFLAAVTGGLRRYHDLHEADVTDLRVTMPVSLRTERDPEGGNRITLLRFPLPVALADPAERMRAISETVLRERAERSLPHTQGIAAALNLLPSGVIGSMLKHVDFLASDVPGVPVPVYVAGARVDGWYAFGPTTGAAVNLTLMSYVDTCSVGVNADTAAVPDPERLVSCLVAGFEEVLALGGGQPSVQHPAEDLSWTS